MARNQPFFSIIIPAYNEEKSISRCLDSVAQQTLSKEKYEIIVVNNNSRDRTKIIAQKHPVSAVDEIKQGYIYALRRGCQEAKGKILVFTDADTVVPKDWLTKYQKIYQNPEIVCAGGPYQLHPKIPLSFLIEPSLRIFGTITKIAFGCNFSIRHQAYQKLKGFNAQINFHADIDLILRAKRLGKTAFLADNPVITSNRHFKGFKGIAYSLKGIINFASLVLLKKTIFYEFGNIR